MAEPTDPTDPASHYLDIGLNKAPDRAFQDQAASRMDGLKHSWRRAQLLEVLMGYDELADLFDFISNRDQDANEHDGMGKLSQGALLALFSIAQVAKEGAKDLLPEDEILENTFKKFLDETPIQALTITSDRLVYYANGTQSAREGTTKQAIFDLVRTEYPDFYKFIQSDAESVSDDPGYGAGFRDGMAKMLLLLQRLAEVEDFRWPMKRDA